MLKKNIPYVDYNGNERSENFYFNLTKAELIEMQLGVTGGMKELIETIMNKQDIPKLMAAFKEIIMRSYGEKSPDGRVFRKSKELSDAFSQTEAYSNLYMELLSDGKKAAAFINGILPEGFREDTDDKPEKVLTPVDNGDAHLTPGA